MFLFHMLKIIVVNYSAAIVLLSSTIFTVESVSVSMEPGGSIILSETGESQHYYGNDVKQRESYVSNMTNYSCMAFIDLEHLLPTGMLTSYLIYVNAADSGESPLVVLQLWRRIPGSGIDWILNYHLVWQKTVQVYLNSTQGTLYTFLLDDAEQFVVRGGDQLGWRNLGRVGPISFTTDTNSSIYAENVCCYFGDEASRLFYIFRTPSTQLNETFSVAAQVLPLQCLYGNTTHCLYPCRCKDSSEICDPQTGFCRSGCADGPGAETGPLFKWTGPGCRIGNYGFGNFANSYSNDNTTGSGDNLTADGVISPFQVALGCLQVFTNEPVSPKLTISFSRYLIVHNVTLFFPGGLFDTSSVRIFADTANSIDLQNYVPLCSNFSAFETYRGINGTGTVGALCEHEIGLVAIQLNILAMIGESFTLCEVVIMAEETDFRSTLTLSRHVTSIYPSFGPVDGSTRLTISGQGFDDEFSLALSTYLFPVYIPYELSFAVISRNSSCIVAETSFLDTQQFSEGMYELFFMYDSLPNTGSQYLNYYTGWSFQYLPNPVIDEVKPQSSIANGGVMLTVTGSYLQSVIDPILRVIVDVNSTANTDRPARSLSVVKTTHCISVNDTRMYCPTPELTEYSQYASNSDGLINNPNLQFYIGFALDGVRSYTDLRTSPIPQYAQLDVFTGPNIFTSATQYYQMHSNSTLMIRGERLDKGCSLSDYTIAVETGTGEIIALDDTTLIFHPPDDIPKFGTGADRYLIDNQSRVWVQVGNLRVLAYHIIYGTNTGILASQSSLLIIIPVVVVGVVCLIVVATVFAIS